VNPAVYSARWTKSGGRARPVRMGFTVAVSATTTACDITGEKRIEMLMCRRR